MSRTGPSRVLVVSSALLVVLVASGLVAASVARSSAAGRESHPGVTSVEVDQDCAGDVTVLPADAGGDAVEVARADRWTFGRPRHTAEVVDGRLTVSTDCPDLQLFWTSASDLTLRVPAGVEVRVSAGAGAVRARGTTGDLDLSTSAGEVAVSDVTGRLHLSAGAGRISATGVTAEEVTAESSAGQVTVSAVAPVERLSATSSAGAVTVELPDDGTRYDVRADTSAGAITVDVPQDPDSPRVVEARSSAGSVTVRTAG
ncbi:DUF4097 family beta strand repeat-containing protein [Modestobacter sp. SYSU DS0511]